MTLQQLKRIHLRATLPGDDAARRLLNWLLISGECGPLFAGFELRDRQVHDINAPLDRRGQSSTRTQLVCRFSRRPDRTADGRLGSRRRLHMAAHLRWLIPGVRDFEFNYLAHVDDRGTAIGLPIPADREYGWRPMVGQAYDHVMPLPEVRQAIRVFLFLRVVDVADLDRLPPPEVAALLPTLRQEAFAV